MNINLIHWHLKTNKNLSNKYLRRDISKLEKKFKFNAYYAYINNHCQINNLRAFCTNKSIIIWKWTILN